MTVSPHVTTAHTPSLTCGCPACVAAYLSGLGTKGSSADTAVATLGAGSLLVSSQASIAAPLVEATSTAPANAAPATTTAASPAVGASLPKSTYTGIMPDGLSATTYVQALLAGGNFWWQINGGSTVPTATNGLTGAAHTLTYSFLTSDFVGDTGSVFFAAMGPNEQAAVKAALAYISSLFDITFVQVAAGTGEINYGTNDQGSTSAAYSQYANTNGKANVMISNDVTYGYGEASDYSPGTYAWEVLLHETGHALGLKHPGNYNAGGGGTGGPYLPTDMDDRQYSIMSYNNASNTLLSNSNYYINPSTYQLYDFYALQYLYGANMSGTSPQNQIFSWGYNANIYETLYATGANNEINISNQSRPSFVNLNPGTFSSIDELNLTKPYYNGVDDVAIAPNARIDTLILGGGASTVIANNDGDQIYLGSGSDTITGGAGNDTFYLDYGGATNATMTINGGGGSNVAFVFGPMSAYHIAYSNGVITLTSGSVTDTLTNIGGVDFNGTWYVPAGQGPVISITSPDIHTIASPSISIALDAMFSVGDTVSASGLSYGVTDNGGAGHFFINGVEQANYTQFSLTAVQLYQTTYIAAAGGTDQITVLVYDGHYRATATFAITSVVAVAPTITLHPVSGLYVPESVALSSMFSVVDHNNYNSSALTYTITDIGGAGFFVVNGINEANYSPFTLTAAQLAGTYYVALSGGTDTISLTASDGASSTSTSFTITSLNYPPPVVTPVNAAVTASNFQSFIVDQLFTTTDPNPNASPTFYQLELSDAKGGSGLLSEGIQGERFNSDTVLTLAATNLNFLDMTAEIYSGQETLWVRASDGTATIPHWGAWTKFTITAPVLAKPQLSPVSVTLPDISTLSGSALVSILSLGDDGIAQYEFRDPNQVAGKDPAGWLAANGIPQADFTVNLGDLSEVSFIANSTAAGLSATIDVRTWNLTGYSPWVVDTIKIVDRPPVVTAVAPQTATRDQIFSASDLFSSSDPVAGATISQYEFFASNASGADGVLLNSSLQANNTGIFVAASNLGTVTFESISGTDILYVRANDGTAAKPHWGAWSAITVTVPTAIFTPTSTTIIATYGETFLTSMSSSPLSLFSAADASGSAIQQYEFFDNDSAGGSGYLLMNGVALKNDTVDLVNAASLSQLSYMAISGSEVIAVRANDGTLAHPVWGAWGLITVTVPAAVVARNNATITATRNEAYVTTDVSSPLSLFTASDPGGGTIQQYEFFDNDAGGGSGNLLQNSTVLKNDTVQLVNAADLTKISYRAVSGTEVISVRANDGTLAHPVWGAWSSVTVTVTTAAPTASSPPVPNLSATGSMTALPSAGQSVASPASLLGHAQQSYSPVLAAGHV
jgi:hypothetical protein